MEDGAIKLALAVCLFLRNPSCQHEHGTLGPARAPLTFERARKAETTPLSGENGLARETKPKVQSTRNSEAAYFTKLKNPAKHIRPSQSGSGSPMTSAFTAKLRVPPANWLPWFSCEVKQMRTLLFSQNA